MKWSTSALAFAVLASPSAALAAGEKLLISEVIPDAPEAEYVEIYNPGAAPVDLTDYYLADYQTYYEVVIQDTPSLENDFLIRFPAGATIQPGEFQTVLLKGAECFYDGCGAMFFTGFGVYPTYEVAQTDPMKNNDNVADMVVPFPGAVGPTYELTNAGELMTLFYWDGMSDLVYDADYVFFGFSGNTPNNKTGVMMDGPDVGITPTAYLPDTPDSPALHAPLYISGGSPVRVACRLDFTETGQVMMGGNGVSGADETSEPCSTTWTTCMFATPNDGDPDLDGLMSSMDNCPQHPNPMQEDSDGDGIGDACEGGQNTGGGSPTGSGVGGSGGSMSMGGAGGSAATGAPAGPGTSDEGGCGCRTAGEPNSSPSPAPLLMLAGALALVRRRRSG